MAQKKDTSNRVVLYLSKTSDHDLIAWINEIEPRTAGKHLRAALREYIERHAGGHVSAHIQEELFVPLARKNRASAHTPPEGSEIPEVHKAHTHSAESALPSAPEVTTSPEGIALPKDEPQEESSAPSAAQIEAMRDLYKQVSS